MCSGHVMCSWVRTLFFDLRNLCCEFRYVVCAFRSFMLCAEIRSWVFQNFDYYLSSHIYIFIFWLFQVFSNKFNLSTDFLDIFKCLTTCVYFFNSVLGYLSRVYFGPIYACSDKLYTQEPPHCLYKVIVSRSISFRVTMLFACEKVYWYPLNVSSIILYVF